jgi:DNA-directed RNA polymerase specialized sigma24 family protein
MTDRSKLSPEEANQLWEAYRSGGNPSAMRAIDTLYRTLRPVLIEFCKSKGCDAELADEITEQAFFRLMHRKPQARSGFVSLIRKTAQNLVADARADARADADAWADAQLPF